jgi:hypothetical protein
MHHTLRIPLAIYLVLFTLTLSLFASPVVSAGILSDRKVEILNSTQSVVTSHNFSFTVPGFDPIGSIQFEYCENSPLPEVACDAPAGLSTSAAVLDDQSGETGFSILNPPQANKIILTRTATPSSALPVSYDFGNITNPSEANKPVYIRISTYVSEDATGSATDAGSVVFSTAQNIAVNGFVPPYIIFCVGVTVDVDCMSTAGSLLNFGELSTSQTRSVTSQYSGSTNDPGGYTTTLSGATMTSGTNTIAPLSTAGFSQPGQPQFGLNLRDNSSPDVGTEPAGPGTSAPTGQAANVNQFYYGNSVISSSAISTDFKRFTVSYIVNVPTSQPSGIYATTVTYIAVAAF